MQYSNCFFFYNKYILLKNRKQFLVFFQKENIFYIFGKRKCSFQKRYIFSKKKLISFENKILSFEIYVYTNKFHSHTNRYGF